MEEQPQLPVNEPKKISTFDTLKSRQFLAGFFGWYIVNGVVWFVLPKFAVAVESLWTANMFFFFPLNLLALIILPLVKRTRKFGLGILAAVAVNFILSILSGAFFNALCFWPFYFR